MESKKSLEVREAEIAQKLERLAGLEKQLQDAKSQANNNQAAAEILGNMVASGAAVLENDGSVTLKSASVLGDQSDVLEI